MFKVRCISKLKEHPNSSTVEDHLMKTSVFLKLELSLKEKKKKKKAMKTQNGLMAEEFSPFSMLQCISVI